MARILVRVETDLNDPDLALRSVASAMRRAGYNQIDYRVFTERLDSIECAAVDGVLIVAAPEG